MARVARLNIAPVRSLGLQHPEAIELTMGGVAEDRRFYVTDATNRLLDQIAEGRMVQVSAWTDPEATRLRLGFPDGTVIDDEVTLGAPVETDIHKRKAIGRLVDGPWAAALSDFLGREVRIVRCDVIGGTRIRPGEVTPRHPATIVGDGSLVALEQGFDATGRGPTGAIDPRRFRMLIELEGTVPHEEDGWLDGCVEIGGAALRISGQVARCAMTTHDPNTGARDLDTLHAIKAYRGLIDGDLMFGVYGEVERPGTIRIGDEATVLASG